MRLFLIALATGAASAFAFEPVGLWPLILVAFALLCELLSRTESLKRALLIGWGFAVGQFVVGLNWIATAFTYQAAMPAWLGWVAVVLLSLYLAVYPMLAAALAWTFGRTRRVALVLALAGAWAITEWLRARMFTGFSWNPVGVTLVDTPWRTVSFAIGTYGLSTLVVLAGGAFWLTFRRAWKQSLAVALPLGLLLLLPGPQVPDQGSLVDYSGEPLPQPPMLVGEEEPAPAAAATPPLAERSPDFSAVRPRPIRIVQPNIGQEDKWREGLADEAFQRLSALSAGGTQQPRLLFWPEVAVPEPFQFLSADRRPLRMPLPAIPRALQSVRPGDVLLTGAFALITDENGTITGNTNSVFALDQSGRVFGRYDKAHLVPYGEYLPMRPLLTSIGLSQLAPGIGDTAFGPGPRTIQIPGWGKVGVQICYEIIFSGEVVDQSNRPNFIFNPSNDAWFGRWGPPQHLAQARLRAAEEGLPVVRSTPTGISALIDARGRLLASIPWREAGVIDATLPLPAAGLTPFARFGNWIPLSLGFLLLIGGIALGVGRRYRQT